MVATARTASSRTTIHLASIRTTKVWFVIVDAPDFDTGQARGHEILQRIAKGYGWGVSEVRPWDDAFPA